MKLGVFLNNYDCITHINMKLKKMLHELVVFYKIYERIE